MEITILEYTYPVWIIEVDENVFGVSQQFELEVTNTDEENEEYTFEIRDFYAQDTSILLSFEDAHEYNTQTIDPAKVLLWILKQVKKALCPECM